ncbi:MAG: hypothetical protein XD93_0535 [candidate division WS6 bacterium 34_10]|uniref:Uncharacterized protein n=1 Tax=candidate division WS6 bacterium 34_10 TaxID=1641389 RepID=A0A101HHQ5_9BACT|nr:MAG: hypothetical protein XD93_0535 [candidate division WS6 bacterium 34_10]
MTAHGYFSNWFKHTDIESSPLSMTYESPSGMKPSVFDNTEMNSFYCCPGAYFEQNGTQTPQLIEGFLNKELLESDPKLFKELYIKLLRHACLTTDKECAADAIANVIYSEFDEDYEVVNFLDKEGLLDLTHDWLDIVYSQGYQVD